MAINFLPQAQLRLGRQELDFSGLTAGIDSMQQRQRQNQMLAAQRQEAEANRMLQRERFEADDRRADAALKMRQREFDANRTAQAASLDMQRQRFGMEKQQFEAGQEARALQKWAGLGQMVLQMPPEQRAGAWQKIYNAHPKVAERLQQYGIGPTDFDRGAQLLIAEARGYQEPSSNAKPPAGYRYLADGSLDPIPGGPATKLPGDVASRSALIEQGLSELPKARELLGLVPDENEQMPGIDLADRANLALGRGRAGQANRIIRQLVEATLRAQTGAAAPQAEVDNYMNIYGASYDDRAETMLEKINRLESLMTQTRANLMQGRVPRASAPQPPGAAQQPGARKPLREMTTEELLEERRRLSGG